jgi:hypothetical protein
VICNGGGLAPIGGGLRRASLMAKGPQ